MASNSRFRSQAIALLLMIAWRASDDRLAGLLGHIKAARRAVVLEQAEGVELLGPRMVDYAAFLQRSVDP